MIKYGGKSGIDYMIVHVPVRIERKESPCLNIIIKSGNFIMNQGYIDSTKPKIYPQNGAKEKKNKMFSFFQWK